MAEGRNLLVAMFQGGGNIPQLLPIVARLVMLGHRVRVLVGPGVRRSRLPVSESLWRSLHATGAQILRLREPEVHPWDMAPSAQGLLFGWTPQAFRSVEQEARAQSWLPHWADEVAAELQRAPADVLVADFVLVGALVAAEAASVPAAVLFHALSPRPVPGRPPYGPGWVPAVGLAGRLRDAAGTFVVNRLYAQDALPPLKQARTRLGLPPLRWYFAQYDRAARVVALMSPHFDFPAQGMPPNVRLVGTPLDEVTPMPWDPPWSTAERQPRILVSLSTLNQGQALLMGRILTALEGLPVQAIVTLGPSLAASQFTPPPNVTLETFIPHAAVLPHVDAMVTQCGLGTLMKALTHGVPLVCIPLVGDQPDNAARVTARGAGLRVSAEAPPARIREAIQRVVTDPSCKQAAHQLATKMAGEDAVQAAVDEIISLTEKRPERGTG
jgi:UDP:flavonoid glycosyltransferase YjiC (YdhE family)